MDNSKKKLDQFLERNEEEIFQAIFGIVDAFRSLELSHGIEIAPGNFVIDHIRTESFKLLKNRVIL